MTARAVMTLRLSSLECCFLMRNVQKDGRPKRRPESREETPKEASAANMLHCNNDPGTSFVQRKRRADCLPLFLPNVEFVNLPLTISCEKSQAGRFLFSCGRCESKCV